MDLRIFVFYMSTQFLESNRDLLRNHFIPIGQMRFI